MAAEPAAGNGRLSRRQALTGLGVVAASATTGALTAALIDDGGGQDVAAAVDLLEYVYGETSDPAEGRFNDWEELIRAVAEAPPGDKWVAVETDRAVPRGRWDLNGAGFRGDEAERVGLPPHGNPVIVTFEDGARLENASRHFARDGIVLWSESSRPVVTVDDERSYYFADDAWVVSTDAAFFEVTATASTLVLFSFRTGSGLVRASTTGLPGRDRESIDHTGAATLIIAMASGNNIFDDDTVKGNGVVIAAMSPAAGIREPDQPRGGFSHRNASNVTTLLFSTAENVAYQPANPADWPQVPGDVASALDRLASRLTALEGG